MIAKQFRFHGHVAMRHVYSRGQTVRGPGLAVRYVSNPRRSQYRAAVVVSRKVHKSAVVRNRIRRRIYEIIRSQQPAIKQPFDIVVTVFDQQLAVVAAEELRTLVVGQLRQAGIISV